MIITFFFLPQDFFESFNVFDYGHSKSSFIVYIYSFLVLLLCNFVWSSRLSTRWSLMVHHTFSLFFRLLIVFIFLSRRALILVLYHISNNWERFFAVIFYSFQVTFFLASTDEERKRTKNLYLVPVFSKINQWVARDISDIQPGFFVLIRDLEFK